MTNFERVIKLNDAAGNTKTPTWDVANKQLKLIDLEFNELKKAVANGDVLKLRDGIADVLVTAYGLAHRLGIDADKDMGSVCDALWSRFDNSESNAQATKEKYLKLGVPTFIRNSLVDGVVMFITIVECDTTGLDDEFYPAGKWLKSAFYKEPVFEGDIVINGHPLV